MVSLARFYSVKSHILTIAPIIQGQHDVSLRVVDWFVTNYAKKHGTVITQHRGNNIVHFNVYLSYRSQLKAYSKQAFDPFRRRERITFVYDRDNSIETTIGQLNFFRWMLENNILEYVRQNLADIEQDMMELHRQESSKGERPKRGASSCDHDHSPSSKHRPDESKKKRNEISPSFVRNMNKFEGKRVISFD